MCDGQSLKGTNIKSLDVYFRIDRVRRSCYGKNVMYEIVTYVNTRRCLLTKCEDMHFLMMACSLSLDFLEEYKHKVNLVNIPCSSWCVIVWSIDLLSS